MGKQNKKVSSVLICVWIIIILILMLLSNLVYFNIDSYLNIDDTKAAKELMDDKEIKDNSGENNKKIYLTFDDGPTVRVEILLDILDKYNAKATFFLVGYIVDERPYLAKIIYDRGHSIGMHSYSHSEKIYEDLDSFKNDLKKSEEAFKKALGFVPKLYRFPYGSHNKYIEKDSSEKLKKELIKRGYNYYDWNVSTGDGSKIVNGYDIYVNAVNGIENENNPVTYA